MESTTSSTFPRIQGTGGTEEDGSTLILCFQVLYFPGPEQTKKYLQTNKQNNFFFTTYYRLNHLKSTAVSRINSVNILFLLAADRWRFPLGEIFL